MLRIGRVGRAESGGLSSAVTTRFPNVQLKEIDVGSFGPQLGEYDAIWIDTAVPESNDLCAQAAAAGKHLLVDLRSISQEVIEVVSNAKCRFMVGNSLRFLPSLRTVKEQLDAGKLGEPGLLRIHRWQSRVECDASLRNPLAREIDLACWLFGRLPIHVYAVGRQDSALPESFDYVQLHLGFSDGGMALLDECRSLPAGDGYFSLSLIGSTGAAYADDHHNTQLLFRGGHPSALNTGQDNAELFSQVHEFIGAIEKECEPSIGAADANNVLRVTTAMIESLAAKQTVNLESSP